MCSSAPVHNSLSKLHVDCDASPLTPDTVETDVSKTTDKFEVCPEPGRTFILRTIDTKRVLVLRDGEVSLMAKPTEAVDKIQRSRWYCVEMDG